MCENNVTFKTGNKNREDEESHYHLVTASNSFGGKLTEGSQRIEICIRI